MNIGIRGIFFIVIVFYNKIKNIKKKIQMK